MCLNSEKHIEQTMRSVLKQTYNNYEYIIIDGGSNDGTINIIKSYYEKFKGRLKWISETDSGIYDAMNKGIKLAKGDIIGIINSDDWYNQKALEVIANMYFAYERKETIYVGSMNIFGNRNSKYIVHNSKKRLKKFINVSMPINHPAMFASKQVYDKIGCYNPDYIILGDYDFVFRAYYGGIDFLFTKIVIVNFRKGGISSRNILLRTVESYKVRKKYIYFIPNLVYTLLYFASRVKEGLKKCF